MSEQFVLLTGCSGGGKSTLLQALSDLGFATIPEPGRRIVAQEIAANGTALPWVDMQAFALRALEMAKSDLKIAQRLDGVVFFDRGLIDAAVALEFCDGPSRMETLGKTRHYVQVVFVVPPWKEIFITDAERKHGFDDAVNEYNRIMNALDDLGYDTLVLPHASVDDRIAIVLNECSLT